MTKGHYILLGMIIGVLTMLVDNYLNKPDKHIDLPEEWPIAKQGDTLKIYKLNADTIFIGFYNSDNRNDKIYLKK